MRRHYRQIAASKSLASILLGPRTILTSQPVIRSMQVERFAGGYPVLGPEYYKVEGIPNPGLPKAPHIGGRAPPLYLIFRSAGPGKYSLGRDRQKSNEVVGTSCNENGGKFPLISPVLDEARKNYGENWINVFAGSRSGCPVQPVDH